MFKKISIFICIIGLLIIICLNNKVYYQSKDNTKSEKVIEEQPVQITDSVPDEEPIDDMINNQETTGQITGHNNNDNNKNNININETKSNNNVKKEVKETPKEEKSKNKVQSESKKVETKQENIQENIQEDNKQSRTIKNEPWKELGISENDYYNKPMWSWMEISFSIDTYGSQSNTEKACREYADPIAQEQGKGFSCTNVLSYSGRYLGEYLQFF